VAGSRYSQSVDLDNWNSSHSLAVLSVPPGSRVLDLGAADGSVARALKKRACTVWGIEQDERAAEAASQVCDRVIVADLEAKEAFEPLGSETFDVVLALDVLEHLRDPAPVLKRAASYLTPGGIAVLSIPNVTHGALRLSLLEGRFNYTEQGLLDRTHLRFFDRHAAEQLISEAGLTISQHLRVRRELEETEIAVNKDGLPIELLQSLASDPDATTYQFVFVAGRTHGSAITHSGSMLAERLLAENEGLRAQFKELESYIKNLEADLAVRLDGAARELKECQDELAQARSMQARATAESLEVQRERDELHQELIRRMQEAHQMHRDLRHSRADGVVKEAFISDLRQQLLAIDPVVSQRDQLATVHKRLSAKCEQLVARRHQLVEERDRLLARQEALETKLRALQTHVNSAGFRIVENVTRHLRRFPTAFRTTRTIARKVVGRSAAAD
jgi:2-polyprenyl-3-methyl-5-hydroxy-6-metoxy-1,4-benzoquinol methylase